MTFSEVQRFSVGIAVAIFGFLIALAGFIAVFATRSPERIQTFCMISLTSLPILALYFAFRLETSVADGRLQLRLSPLAGETIDLSAIQSAEQVSYRPLADFGGWGVRFGLGGKIYSARGTQAVKIVMKSGQVIFIGSQEPERLLSHLDAR